MNKISENELKRITEEKGFEYVGVCYTPEKYHKATIQFICPKHREKGVQYKLVSNMRKSSGKCNYCNGYNRSHSDFLKTMADIDSNIEFLSNYKGAKEDIECRCLVCGYKWISIPNRLLNGSGCIKCGNKSVSKLKTKTHDIFEKEIIAAYENAE